MKYDSGIIIKLFIFITTLFIVIFSSWYFIVLESKKQIQKFLIEQNIKNEKIKISGFPLLKEFTINNTEIGDNNNGIKMQEFTISSPIFSNRFIISDIKNISIYNENVTLDVKYNNSPDIFFSIAKNNIDNFTYSDDGYEIYHNENLSYKQSGLNIILNSGEEYDHISFNMKDFIGFDFLNQNTNINESSKKSLKIELYFKIKEDKINYLKMDEFTLYSEDYNIDINGEFNKDNGYEFIIKIKNIELISKYFNEIFATQEKYANYVFDNYLDPKKITMNIEDYQKRILEIAKNNKKSNDKISVFEINKIFVNE